MRYAANTAVFIYKGGNYNSCIQRPQKREKQMNRKEIERSKVENRKPDQFALIINLRARAGFFALDVTDSSFPGVQGWCSSCLITCRLSVLFFSAECVEPSSAKNSNQTSGLNSQNSNRSLSSDLILTMIEMGHL